MNVQEKPKGRHRSSGQRTAVGRDGRRKRITSSTDSGGNDSELDRSPIRTKAKVSLILFDLTCCYFRSRLKKNNNKIADLFLAQLNDRSNLIQFHSVFSFGFEMLGCD